MNYLAKVCGLTRTEDAAFAAAQGAHLLGFVRHAASPRHCQNLAIACPYLDRAVLVQVSERVEDILCTAQQHGFRKIQPYLPSEGREEGVQRLRAEGLMVILPWVDAPDQAPIPAELYLWEPSREQTGVYGGSGQGHALAFPPPGPFLLAGGLDGFNLGTRFDLLPPATHPLLRGFDAASGLEQAPGIKSPERVAAFIEAAARISQRRKEFHV